MDYNANDSISSDDSTSSVGSDSSVRLSEFISRRVEAETDNLQSGWTFQAHSKRGAEMHGRLNSRTYKKEVKVGYDSVNNLLMEKMIVEVEHALNMVRKKLKLNKTDVIGAMTAFAGALPEDLLYVFHKWLTDTESHEGQAVKFEDIVEFLRCEIVMRLYSVSANQLDQFGIACEEIESYEKVRKVMSVADKPASTKQHHIAGATAVANTIDPLMKEAVRVVNTEWVKLFFVLGVSWMDIDDDKLNFCSKLWKKYGFKMTPTKDKKLKPVIHIAATTGSGHICHLTLDELNLKLGEMMKKTIE